MVQVQHQPLHHKQVSLSRVLLGVLVLQVVASSGLPARIWTWVELASHYAEHRLLDGELGPSEFFALHYGDLAEAHAMDEDHSDLPFKGGDHPFVPHALTLVTPPAHALAIREPEEPACGLNFRAPEMRNPILACRYWQPPRQA